MTWLLWSLWLLVLASSDCWPRAGAVEWIQFIVSSVNSTDIAEDLIMGAEPWHLQTPTPGTLCLKTQPQNCSFE